MGWKIEDKLLGIVAFFFGVFLCSSILFGFLFINSSTYKLISFFIILLIGFSFYEIAIKKDVIRASISGVVLGLFISFIFVNKGIISSKSILEVLNSLLLGEKSLMGLEFITKFQNPLIYLPSILLGSLFAYRQEIGEKIFISFLAALVFSTGIKISGLEFSFIWNSGIILSDLFFILLLLVFLIQLAIDRFLRKKGDLISFEEINRSNNEDTKKEDEPMGQTTSSEHDEMSDFGNFADENEFNF